MADATSLAVSLAGRIALVTGGAAGIGGGTSRVLARAGAHVVILDIDPELTERARAEITGAGGEATVLVGDVRDPAVVDEAVGTAVDVAGHLDVLVNNVGDYRPNGYFIRSTEDMWEANHGSIFQHVLRCCRAVLPHMVDHGGGSIVNVSSVEAFRGAPGNAVYNAYNAAVSMLRGRDPELVRSWIPIGRFGRPEEYGAVVLFLASDLSSYVTGHTIPVDGGTIAASGWYGRYTKRGFSNLPDLAP